MRKLLGAIALAIPVAGFAQAAADSVSPRAKQLHDRAIVVDSHADTTQRLITDALLKKGYSEADIEKILGGNILRVMETVEKLKGA